VLVIGARAYVAPGMEMAPFSQWWGPLDGSLGRMISDWKSDTAAAALDEARSRCASAMIGGLDGVLDWAGVGQWPADLVDRWSPLRPAPGRSRTPDVTA
jgi:hypothetical protein